MKNFLLAILCICSLFFACNPNSNEENTSQDDLFQSDTNVQIQDTLLKATVDTIKITEDVILFPDTYRIFNHMELKGKLAGRKWQEIYKKDNNYYVDKANYSLSEIEEDPCSGFPAQIIESSNNALLLFSIPNIKPGKLDTVAFSETIIQAGKSFEFSYNKHNYTLKASGISFFSENGHTPNGTYNLVLFSDQYPEGHRIITQSEYNDTCTELLMISDLDKDGFPDFIFSSPRDYEEERYLIILSSSNQIYEGNRQFDC